MAPMLDQSGSGMPKFKPRKRKTDADGVAIEQRRAPRLPSSSIPSLRSARIVAGPEIQLVNISRVGAMLETNCRIAPGSSLSIRLVTADTVNLLRGRVLRSSARRLDGKEIVYECRVAFDEDFGLLPEAPLPRDVSPEDDGNPAGAPASGESGDSSLINEDNGDEILTLTVAVPWSGSVLRQRLT